MCSQGGWPKLPPRICLQGGAGGKSKSSRWRIVVGEVVGVDCSRHNCSAGIRAMLQDMEIEWESSGIVSFTSMLQ